MKLAPKCELVFNQKNPKDHSNKKLIQKKLKWTQKNTSLLSRAVCELQLVDRRRNSFQGHRSGARLSRFLNVFTSINNKCPNSETGLSENMAAFLI